MPRKPSINVKKVLAYLKPEHTEAKVKKKKRHLVIYFDPESFDKLERFCAKNGIKKATLGRTLIEAALRKERLDAPTE
jgi:hypothetical protein